MRLAILLILYRTQISIQLILEAVKGKPLKLSNFQELLQARRLFNTVGTLWIFLMPIDMFVDFGAYGGMKLQTDWGDVTEW